MKIVIDIPKEDWEFLKASEGCRWSWTILEGVMNGMPLPKGHGDLIDRSETLRAEDEIAEIIGGNNVFAECIREAVKAVFDNAKTIIPAEKE